MKMLFECEASNFHASTGNRCFPSGSWGPGEQYWLCIGNRYSPLLVYTGTTHLSLHSATRLHFCSTACEKRTLLKLKLFGDNHPNPWLPVSGFVDRKWGITAAFASPTSACAFDMSHLGRTVGFSCGLQTCILFRSSFCHLQAQTMRAKWAWPRGRKVSMTKPPAQWQKQMQHKYPPSPGSHSQPFEGPHLKWTTCGIAGILCVW